MGRAEAQQPQAGVQAVPARRVGGHVGEFPPPPLEGAHRGACRYPSSVRLNLLPPCPWSTQNDTWGMQTAPKCVRILRFNRVPSTYVEVSTPFRAWHPLSP